MAVACIFVLSIGPWFFLVVALTVVVLGLDHYTSTAQGGGRGGW